LPVKRITALRLTPLLENALDPALLLVSEPVSEQAATDGSNRSSSIQDDDSEHENEVLKNESKKRLTADEVGYQTDKRKRDVAYRNMSERLRENLRKLSNKTHCYAILFLSRDSQL
jgi:hypothetical protein